MKLVAQFCSSLETNHHEVSGVLQMIRHKIPNGALSVRQQSRYAFSCIYQIKTVMLEALSIAIDLTLFYCFADTSLSPFGEKKVEALQGVQSQISTAISYVYAKIFKTFCSYAQYIEPAWWWTDFTCMRLFH